MEMLDGDVGSATTILAGFIEDATIQIESIKRALEERNFSELKQRAHTLKSASGNVGAQLLQKLATDLEKASEEKHIEELPILIGKLEASFEEFESIVHA